VLACRVKEEELVSAVTGIKRLADDDRCVCLALASGLSRMPSGYTARAGSAAARTPTHLTRIPLRSQPLKLHLKRPKRETEEENTQLGPTEV